MPEEPTHSDRSAALARADKAHLLHSIEVARSLGAVSPGHGGEPPPGVDDPSFDPALDLPLGMEPVGARPRELVLRETDPPGEMLPRGILAQTAVEELAKAAAELGCPTFTIGYWIATPRPDGYGPAAFRDEPTRPPNTRPPHIRVDLTGGESRPTIRSSLIDAVMEAAVAPRRPTTIYPDFVDEERRARWPRQKAMRRRIDGLRERLEDSAGTDTSGHVGRWFPKMGWGIQLEAYDSGVPVSISGTASVESGFQATWIVSANPYSRPSINLTASAYEPAETVRHVIDLILFAHGIERVSDEGQHLGRQMWAAAVARLTPMPETPPL